MKFYSPMLFAVLCLPSILGMVPESVHAEEGGDREEWSARMQTTYIWQQNRPFASPYSATNSLDPGKNKSYTFSATADLAFRPWQNGEIYFNPEIVQGMPFSGLAGLGTFSNGEATRAAGTSPKGYRQRLFLRQTWNNGGSSEKQEAEWNQLAGEVDKNRFVLTVGNFSILDVFDDNAYAKDSRNQFFNAANMTYGAYDYAADARGFGWGATGEWYQDEWVFRFGRMTGPREPNMLPLDYRIFRHYGDQIEVEHAHRLFDQPGKIRVIGWRNRAVMARFRDAINDGTTRGGTPDIFRVRNSEQTKYGAGINFEQAANDDLGFFMRAMKADGRTETLAFTEVDGSLSLGASLKGSAWGRAQDTVGLSFARNTLSHDRRNYLAAGGLSFFIGDGALNYRPEQIAETYYSVGFVKGVSLSFDYQHYRNPAYNADRGPVSIASARFHAEF